MFLFSYFFEYYSIYYLALQRQSNPNWEAVIYTDTKKDTLRQDLVNAIKHFVDSRVVYHDILRIKKKSMVRDYILRKIILK